MEIILIKFLYLYMYSSERMYIFVCELLNIKLFIEFCSNGLVV